MPSDPKPVATMERLLRPTALFAETVAAALRGGLRPKAAAAKVPTVTTLPAGGRTAHRSLRAPVLWGLVFGGLQAASPLAFRWLDPATVHALSITLIASVYIGFAVADGRPRIIAVEVAVASLFVVLAATAAAGTPWLLVLGYAGHGIKDFWQERTQYVANTRWWPPFCAAVDWLVAIILVVEIAAGVDFHY